VEASLYVHVPFCAGACDYCDFYSVSAGRKDPRLDAYVPKLLEEVAESLTLFGVQAVPTVFIGGGTPSLLGSARIRALLDGLAVLLPSRPREFTMEANPESVDAAFIDACGEGGVDRLSVGIQSLDPRARREVGRIGPGESVAAALDLIRSRFRGRLSVDLISGLPSQDEASLLSDIAAVVSAGADHVSLYSLTLGEGTPLAARSAAGTVRLPSGDAADELWISGRDELERLGLGQYEISNFARPGSECLHNLRYWRMESWLGCGPAASRTVVDEPSATAVRLTRERDVDAWLAGSGAGEEERIGTKDLIAETLLMSFRLKEGIAAGLFRSRFGVPPEFFIGRTLGLWRSRGLARADAVALGRDGLLLLDRFLVDCLAELDGSYCRYEESRR